MHERRPSANVSSVISKAAARLNLSENLLKFREVIHAIYLNYSRRQIGLLSVCIDNMALISSLMSHQYETPRPWRRLSNMKRFRALSYDDGSFRRLILLQAGESMGRGEYHAV